MAIWEAIVGGEKKRLDDDGALYLLQVFGVGLPPARRLKVRSPQQHGSTDIGYRYDEREMRLAFYFNAKNPAGAVAKRDELYGFWKALEATPVQLRYTRDDASVRQIDCYVAGVVDMAWDPDRNQMGQQDFVVQVEAANPMWYNPTQNSVTFDEDDNLDWWLALGTITAEQVEDVQQSPSITQNMNDDIFVGSLQPWTIYLRSADPGGTTNKTAFYLNTPTVNAWELRAANNNQVTDGNGIVTGVVASGTNDYFIVADGTIFTVYRNTTNVGSSTSQRGLYGAHANAVWRSQPNATQQWDVDIPYAAIYNVALSSNQRASLVAAINGTGIGVSKTITYAGSFRAYPIITIAGPITDPVLTNVSTGETLDFTGITISGGDSYTIDCRFGYKTVRNAAGTNKIAELSSDSDLATFHLGADPEVSDGANAFTLTGTSTDSNTQVTVAYYERYVGA